jgi:hypothetical protein
MQDIAVEREHQDKQWGGNGHDDAHETLDWFEYIDQQIDKSIQENFGFTNEKNIAKFGRPRLIKIAALAIAAVESIDRREVLK